MRTYAPTLARTCARRHTCRTRAERAHARARIQTHECARTHAPLRTHSYARARARARACTLTRMRCRWREGVVHIRAMGRAVAAQTDGAALHVACFRHDMHEASVRPPDRGSGTCSAALVLYVNEHTRTLARTHAHARARTNTQGVYVQMCATIHHPSAPGLRTLRRDCSRCGGCSYFLNDSFRIRQEMARPPPLGPRAPSPTLVRTSLSAESAVQCSAVECYAIRAVVCACACVHVHARTNRSDRSRKSGMVWSRHEWNSQAVGSAPGHANGVGPGGLLPRGSRSCSSWRPRSTSGAPSSSSSRTLGVASACLPRH